VEVSAVEAAVLAASAAVDSVAAALPAAGNF
jgi:hypothetical protein